MKKVIILMSVIFTVISSTVCYAGEWRQDSVGWQYADDNGTVLKESWYMDRSNDSKYYFDSNGYMLTGLVTIDGREYYFEETGAARSNGTAPDGRPTDANGRIFNSLNDGLTVALASATETNVESSNVLSVSIKNQCDKTFTVQSYCELGSQGNEYRLYLYDPETHLFYENKTVKPNEMVTLCFITQDLSKFPIDNWNYVRLHYNCESKEFWSETWIGGVKRLNLSEQELNDGYYKDNGL